MSATGAPAQPDAKEEPRWTRSERLGLAALLASAGLVFALGLWWGLPSWRGWAGDEILPKQVARALARGFSGGWHTKYPPLHYYVLALAEAPVRLLGALGLAPSKGLGVYTVLFLINRAVSVAMALGTVLAIVRVARAVVPAPAGARAGLFAGALVATGAPFVYFAKTANVEMPFLFWFALSLGAYVRLLDDHRLRDYLLFALFAACAITSKDQAYGLYVLAPLAIVPSLARARLNEAGREVDRTGWASGIPAALVDRRFLAFLGAGVLLAAVIYNLAFNLSGFLAHVRTLLGPQSQEAQAFPNTLAGHLGNFVQNLDHLRFCVGWPAFVLGLLGIVHAATTARGRERSRLGAIALLALSYQLTFLAPILFSRDRYVLPHALVLALFAGRLLARLSLARLSLANSGVAMRVLRTAGIALVLGYGALYALTVDARMIWDSRYAAEAWIRSRGIPPGRALAIGRAKHAPRLPVVSWHAFAGALARRRPAAVAVNRVDLRSSSERAGDARLAAGKGGYRPAAVFGERRRWRILDTRGSLSSLVFVDPEIAIYVPTGAPIRLRGPERELPEPGGEPDDDDELFEDEESRGAPTGARAPTIAPRPSPPAPLPTARTAHRLGEGSHHPRRLE